MNKEQAEQLARVLRQLADALENDPSLFENVLQIGTRKMSTRRPTRRLNPFQVLSEEGEPGLKLRLQKLTTRELRLLIQENRLDSSGLSNKWKDKQRLISFAFERLLSRYRHGDVFLEPSRTKTGEDSQRNQNGEPP